METEPSCSKASGLLCLQSLDCWKRGFKFHWGHLLPHVYRAGSGHCDELITCSEKFFWVCVCVCVCLVVWYTKLKKMGSVGSFLGLLSHTGGGDAMKGVVADYLKNLPRHSPVTSEENSSACPTVHRLVELAIPTCDQDITKFGCCKCFETKSTRVPAWYEVSQWS